jgi:hypothetical protein
VPAGPSEPGGALFVRPRDGLVDLRRAFVQRHRVAPSGRALTLFFWGGPAACEKLADVRADSSRRAVRVTVLVGSDPASADAVCPEIAVLKAVRLDLDRPLGARAVVYRRP